MKKKLLIVHGAERILLMNTTKKSLALDPPSLRGSLAGMQYPAIAELKYDGEFDFIYYENDGSTHTINKYGTVRSDFPSLNTLHETLDKRGIKDAILLCEIYWDTGKSGALYDLLSHKKDDNVRIALFDIYSINNVILHSVDLITRKEILFDLFGKWQTEFKVVTNKAEAEIQFLKATQDNWEGVVVKSLKGPLTLGPCSWVKLKYKDRSNYEVNLVDKTKERIEILAPCVNPSHKIPTFIEVGVKCPNKYKKYISVGDRIVIEHQGVLKSGSLRHPVLIADKSWK